MGLERAERTEAPGLEGTPYRFVREIGRGGMGSVHEVEHRALGKRFVMKVLHEKLAHRDDFALRMQREWRTLARLEHPAIVRVTDAGRTTEGLPFFVMERLDGQTLADALHARGRFPAAEAARLVLTVLSGLEAAHRTGAIHRDIKPQNLFLTQGGPKILDFGIAKSKRKGVALVTRSGVAIGTPRYMAPEQAAGLPVDGRADVYACGLVLFEMIAGRDPFAHLKDQAALVGAHINEVPPRLDDVCLDVPAPLGDLLARWLAKGAEDRPASARLAQAELEALLPLLGGDGPELVRAEMVGARAPREDESTAGTSGLSTSTSTSTSTSAALGEIDFSSRTTAPGTVTLDAPPAPIPEAGESARQPSVTPPPLSRIEPAISPSPGGVASGRFSIAALVLLSATVLGLSAFVLEPELVRVLPVTSVTQGTPSFHFPETSGPAPSVAPPSLSTVELPSSPVGEVVGDLQSGSKGSQSATEAPPATVPASPSRPPHRAVPAVFSASDRAEIAPPGAGPRPERAPEPHVPEPGPARQAAPQGSPDDSPAEPPGADLPGSGLW